MVLGNDGMKMKLAVLILTKNEEEVLEECIRCAAFADEILVIDSGSTDRTQEIAERMGARFISRPMDDTGFAGQRNFALTQTEADWVLYLDADEHVGEELAVDMQRAILQPPKAYEIKRETVFLGQHMKHGVYRPDWSLRLFPRNDIFWEGIVHERAQTNLSKAALKGYAEHHAIRSWEQYFRKFNQYTTLMAERMKEKGKKTNFLFAFLHATYAFFHSFFIKRGCMDGSLGWILCVNHFFYTWMKYVKLEALYRSRKRI